MVQYALFIRKPWCEKIFDEGKSWELRSYPLPANKKKEIVAVACSKAKCFAGGSPAEWMLESWIQAWRCVAAGVQL